MFVIVHIIPFGNKIKWPVFIRTILTVIDNPHVKYIALIDKFNHNPQVYPFIDQLIRNSSIQYYNNDNHLQRLVNSLGPNAILLSSNPYKPKKFKYPPAVPIYYVHHGIILGDVTKWPKDCHYLVCSKNCQKMLRKYGHDGRVIFGLPQFQHILNLKQFINNYQQTIRQKFNLKSSTKTVLLIGSSGLGHMKKHALKETQLIYQTLQQLGIDFHLFIKHKYIIKDSHHSGWISKQENITLLNINSLFYCYLACDLVIIQDGNTSTLESLLVNDKTITINDENKDVLAEFPALYAIDNYQNLPPVIEKLLAPNFCPANDYQIQKENFIDLYFKDKDVSNSLVELILKENLST